MKDDVFQVGFNTVRSVFEEYTMGDDFMIFDNLIEKIYPEGKDGILRYDFPFKLDITILAICTEGSARVKVGLNETMLAGGTLGVFLPGQIFQVMEMTRDLKGTFIVFKKSFFNPHTHIAEAMLVRNMFIEQPVIEIPSALMPELVSIYDLIKNKIREEDNHYRAQIIQNYCSIFLFSACNIYMNRNKDDVRKNKSRKEKIFESFISVVKDNYHENHNIGFYADKLCLTPKYLSSIVSEVSGKSAAQWIDDYLILESKVLLRSGNRTIQQISDKLNFSNQSHFGRFFKHHTGMTPKEYSKL